MIKRWADDDSLECWIWSKSDATWIFINNPAWAKTYIYALGEKPTAPPVVPRKTCMLGGLSFPTPETVEPALWANFWIATKDPRTMSWSNVICYKEWLDDRIIHLTKAGALAHYAAI
jgi:hypothetical protein